MFVFFFDSLLHLADHHATNPVRDGCQHHLERYLIDQSRLRPDGFFDGCDGYAVRGKSIGHSCSMRPTYT